MEIDKKSNDELARIEEHLEHVFVVNATICNGIFTIALLFCIVLLIKRRTMTYLPRKL